MSREPRCCGAPCGGRIRRGTDAALTPSPRLPCWLNIAPAGAPPDGPAPCHAAVACTWRARQLDVVARAQIGSFVRARLRRQHKCTRRQVWQTTARREPQQRTVRSRAACPRTVQPAPPHRSRAQWSPRRHAPLHASKCKQSYVNPMLMYMVRIRAWVSLASHAAKAHCCPCRAHPPARQRHLLRPL